MDKNKLNTQILEKLMPMLLKSYEKGVIDFRLRIDTPNHFYIHPMYESGETVDIYWNDTTTKKENKLNIELKLSKKDSKNICEKCNLPIKLHGNDCGWENSNYFLENNKIYSK